MKKYLVLPLVLALLISMLGVGIKGTSAVAAAVKPSYLPSATVNNDNCVTFNVTDCENVGYVRVNDVEVEGRIGYMAKSGTDWTFTFDNESFGKHLYVIIAYSLPIGSFITEAVLNANSTKQYITVMVENPEDSKNSSKPSFKTDAIISGSDIIISVTDEVNVGDISVFGVPGDVPVDMTSNDTSRNFTIGNLQNGDYVFKVVATGVGSYDGENGTKVVEYIVATVYKITLPSIPENVKYDTNEYGRSGHDRPLKVISIEPPGGATKSVILIVFEIHGFEDCYPFDGQVLVDIAYELAEFFYKNPDKLNGHALYIIPSANPDGLAEGYTNNGPGRCQVSLGVDMNREFDYCWHARGDGRYKTLSAVSSPESRSLRDFVLKLNPEIVADIHGWTKTTYGDQSLTKYFQNNIGLGYSGGLAGASGYFSAWAKYVAGAERSALVELPNPYVDHQSVINSVVSLCAE